MENKIYDADPIERLDITTKKINKEITNLENKIDVLAKGPASSEITYDGIRTQLIELYEDKKAVLNLVKDMEESNSLMSSQEIETRLDSITFKYFPKLSSEEEEGGSYLRFEEE